MIRRLKDRSIASLEASLRWHEQCARKGEELGEMRYARMCRELAEETRADLEKRRAMDQEGRE